MHIRPFTEADTASVIALWHAAGLTRPWNDPRRDIERKLAVQPELFLVGELAGEIVASAMGGYDGHRGSVYYLAVAPDQQGKGLGRAMMTRLEELLTNMGCPKLNLLVRTGNERVIGFYEALGYEAQDTNCFGRRLIAD